MRECQPPYQCTWRVWGDRGREFSARTRRVKQIEPWFSLGRGLCVCVCVCVRVCGACACLCVYMHALIFVTYQKPLPARPAHNHRHTLGRPHRRLGQACVYVCMWACVGISMCVYVCTCMYVCTFVGVASINLAAMTPVGYSLHSTPSTSPTHSCIHPHTCTPHGRTDACAPPPLTDTHLHSQWTTRTCQLTDLMTATQICKTSAAPHPHAVWPEEEREEGKEQVETGQGQVTVICVHV